MLSELLSSSDGSSSSACYVDDTKANSHDLKLCNDELPLLLLALTRLSI